MFFKHFWPAILWAILIFLLCSTPGKSIPSSDWMRWVNLDKWVHAFLYFVLFVFLYIGYRKMPNVKTLFTISFLFCVAYGIGIELFQAYLLSDRSGDVPDAVANLMGVVFGILGVRCYRKNWPWQSFLSK